MDMRERAGYIKGLLLALTLVLSPVGAAAQIGEHRDDLSVGVNAGYAMSSVGFVPKVPQAMHGGLSGGVSMRYVCEKYYTMICSVLAEVDFSSMGWKEDILDSYDNRVINAVTGLPEVYSRTINYVQVPVFAHLAWGKEQSGFNFFIQAGPQVGFCLGESTSTNFDLASPNLSDRSNTTVAQYGMEVERKFDYGIAGGMGIELSHPHLGHFLLEGRYYYGLGNIYNSTKRDYFGKSNISGIMVKATYLFDLKKTK